jgi:hypothetical protein
MRQERITKFIVFDPQGAIRNFSPAVDAFLSHYAETEFAVGNVQVMRYKEAWRFSEEMLKNGDFADGLTDWWHVPEVVQDPATRTVPVLSTRGIVQRVPVDDRVVYRYAITGRCPTPGVNVRFWINWFDASGRHAHTTVLARRCDETFQTVSQDITPPAGARVAELIVSGHEPDRILEVSNVSLKW